MVSLKKIRNIIKQYRNRSFRTAVAEEKSQKYLFRDEKIEARKKSWNIFRKNGERISPIGRFIHDKIQISPDIRRRQESYLKFIGLFLISACIYIIAYSPYFQMSPSKVLIEGLDDGIDISIAYRSIEDLYGKNIFFVDEAELAQSLKKNQKNISHIRIDRLYPNNIKILLSGYPIPFDIEIPSVRGKKWGMTENGVLIPKDSLESTPKYKLTYIDSSINNDILLDYTELLSESETIIIKKTIALFEESWPSLSIDKILYLNKENELHIILKNKTNIFFTLQDFTKKTGEIQDYQHLRLQLLTLKTFIENHKEEIEQHVYTYLDTRIPGKIFICKDTQLCNQNIKTIYPDISNTYE